MLTLPPPATAAGHLIPVISCCLLLHAPAGNKYEEAADLLEKAANYYKLGKAWKEATEAYRQLADVQTKQDSKHDAASAYVEGAKCAMKVAPSEGVALLQAAVHLYTDMGRLNMAARQLRDIAEAQEKQGLKEEAIQFYSQAADLFATENATSDANKARIKVAELSAEMDRYQVRPGGAAVAAAFSTHATVVL
jgi:alpha-soluble NSF attachment protein